MTGARRTASASSRAGRWQIDNEVSATAHLALGFTETDRIWTFRKRL